MRNKLKIISLSSFAPSRLSKSYGYGKILSPVGHEFFLPRSENVEPSFTITG